MEQVYTYVGMFFVWGMAALIAANVAYLIFVYVRGFYRACRFANWCWQNNLFKVKVTGWVLTRTVFHHWNEMTWFGKNDTRSAMNGSVFYI